MSKSRRSKNSTLKNFTSFFLSILLLLTCVTGCNDNKNKKGKDDVHFITEEEYKENNSETSSNITLKELTSTGEIPYEYFFNGRSSNYLYNTYKYGDYTNYLDTELFPFYHNGKVGYADAYGNVVISEQYDQAGFFSENKAFVKKDEVWKVIDTKGNELFTVPSGYKPYDDQLFQNGITILQSGMDEYTKGLNFLIINEDFSTKEIKPILHENINWGSLTREVKQISTPEFSGFVLFYDIQIEGNDYHYITIYDLNGTVIYGTQVTYNFYSTFNKSGGCHVDRTFDGPGILEPLWLFEAKNGYINVVDNNGKWGLFNLKTKKLIIPCKYDYVGVASDDGVVNICSYGKWGYIDMNADTLLKPQFKYAGELQNGRAFAITAKGENVIIDKNGNIIDEITSNIWSGSKEEAIIPNSKKSGLFLSVSNAKYDINATVFDSKGKLLVSGVQSKQFYISNKYIFLGGKMYEIIK